MQVRTAQRLERWSVAAEGGGLNLIGGREIYIVTAFRISVDLPVIKYLSRVTVIISGEHNEML